VPKRGGGTGQSKNWDDRVGYGTAGGILFGKGDSLCSAIGGKRKRAITSTRSTARVDPRSTFSLLLQPRNKIISQRIHTDSSFSPSPTSESTIVLNPQLGLSLDSESSGRGRSCLFENKNCRAGHAQSQCADTSTRESTSAISVAQHELSHPRAIEATHRRHTCSQR
jgi:hypothetical protein